MEIRRLLGRSDGSEMCPLRSEDENAARPGTEQVAVYVDLHSVGGAGPGQRSRVEEDLAVRDGAIGLDVEAHPDFARRVGVTYVEDAFIGRKSETIGAGEIAIEHVLAAGAGKDPVVVEFFSRIVGLAYQAVGRVGGVKRPGRMVDQGIGDIETVPVGLVGEGGELG